MVDMFYQSVDQSTYQSTMTTANITTVDMTLSTFIHDPLKKISIF